MSNCGFDSAPAVDGFLKATLEQPQVHLRERQESEIVALCGGALDVDYASKELCPPPPNKTLFSNDRVILSPKQT